MKTTPPRSLPRRQWLALAALSASMGMSGCASPPPPPPPPGRSPAQRKALDKLGFVNSGEGWDLNLASRVLFGFDEAKLSPEGAKALAEVAKTLLSVGINQLTVEGHTDNAGRDDYNLTLSERRAEIVAQALIANGFAPQNIERRGFGASRPVAPNTTDAGRMLNRRAVLIVAPI